MTPKQKTAFLKTICADAIGYASKNQTFIIAKQSMLQEEDEIEKQLKRAISKIDNTKKM